ncbi:MAG: hypothetical protein IJM56_06360 [Clostridia bacterium]|nr:hypothetical protein [Clostridia bacterium]
MQKAVFALSDCLHVLKTRCRVLSITFLFATSKEAISNPQGKTVNLKDKMQQKDYSIKRQKKKHLTERKIFTVKQKLYYYFEENGELGNNEKATAFTVVYVAKNINFDTMFLLVTIVVATLF